MRDLNKNGGVEQVEQDDAKTKLSTIASPSTVDPPVKTIHEVYSPELAKAMASATPMNALSGRSFKVRSVFSRFHCRSCGGSVCVCGPSALMLGWVFVVVLHHDGWVLECRVFWVRWEFDVRYQCDGPVSRLRE